MPIRRIVDSYRTRRKFRRDVKIGRNSVIDARAVIDLRHGGTLTIGDRCTIEAGVILSPWAGSITIGDDVFIGPYTVLYGHGGLTIQDKVLIGAHTVCIPSNHGIDGVEEAILGQQDTAKGILIERGCWIGSAVQVLDGVTIGAGAVIAAGAVVNRNAEPRGVYGGVPATLIRMRGQAQPR